MDSYFVKFPKFQYANTQCRDLTRRAAMVVTPEGAPFMFYPFEVTSGTRADLVSWAHFDDVYKDWVIYLTNGIVDPYYGWNLNNDDFDQYVSDKYGSLEEAQRRVKYYTVNWPDDFERITVNVYETVLPEQLKKYYTPVYGVGADIIGYKRREEDWYANTNRIEQIEITVTSNASFSNGELVNYKNSGEIVGRAEIITCNSTVVFVQHVSGNTSANTNYIVGLTTNAVANVDAYTLMSTPIDVDEFAYWTPVYYYDYERLKNEERKHVLLLDKNEGPMFTEQFRRLMKK